MRCRRFAVHGVIRASNAEVRSFPIIALLQFSTWAAAYMDVRGFVGSMRCGCFRPPTSFTSLRSTWLPAGFRSGRSDRSRFDSATRSSPPGVVGARPRVPRRMACESRFEVPVHRDRARHRRVGQCRHARVRQPAYMDVLAGFGQRRAHLDSIGRRAPSKRTARIHSARLYCRRLSGTLRRADHDGGRRGGCLR